MAAVQVDTLAILGQQCPVLVLLDRRQRQPQQKRWVFARVLEKLLFNEHDRSRGGLHVLLERLSIAGGCLTLDKAAVLTHKTVTQAEFDQVMRLFRSLLDVEAAAKVRKCVVVPITVAISACQGFGRCAATAAFCSALNALPTVWRMQAEQEENTQRGEVDLLLDEDLAEVEEEEAHLADELAASFVPYADAELEHEAVTSWKLSRVPDALTKELETYLAYRTSPLNRARDGTCCVDVTVGNDRRTTLAFLGWLSAEREITPGLGVFCRAALSQWVEDWLKALSEKGLKFSSLANYCNSLCMVGSFVYQTYSIDDDALALPTSALDQLLRLRSQCESQAKQQQLYDRRDPNWLDWSECQEARVRAEAVYKALPESTPHAKKTLALKEWLLIALHTCMPPDRVGIVRKLRLNMTLKRAKEGGFELDMTTTRYKTSRFYGPTISSLSGMLTEPLSLYLAHLEFDSVGTETPYLFHPTQSGDTTRCLPSAQWSQLVSRTLKKHAGKATPPKLLRASFITWLRDSTDAPEVLKAAAKAMRHKEATQQSDRYDKASHDRLMAAAVQYNEKYACRFGSQPTQAGAWVAIGGTFTGNLAPSARQPEPTAAWRLFDILVPYDPATDAYMVPGASVRFSVVPGADGALEYTLPAFEPGTAKSSFSFPAKLSKQGATADAITINGISVRAPTARSEGACAADAPAGAPSGSASAADAPAAAPVAAPVAADEAQLHDDAALDGGELGEADEGLVHAEPVQAVLVKVPDVLDGSAHDHQAAHDRREAEGVQPVGSQLHAVPVAEAHAHLGALGWHLGAAAPNGDCCPLSFGAGYELTAEEARSPTAETATSVSKVRNGAINIVAGGRKIDGVPAATFREQESLPKTTVSAGNKFTPWRANGHWSSAESDGKYSAAFQFGVAAHNKRACIVLERSGDMYEGLRVYAKRDSEGKLVRAAPVLGTPVSIPTSFPISFEGVLEMLRAPTPCSLVAYTANHFSPFLKGEIVPLPADFQPRAPAPEHDDAHAWEDIAGMWRAEKSAEQPSDTCVRYTVQIACDHDARLQPGREVRMLVIGGPTPQTIYRLPPVPTDGSLTRPAYTFTLFVHPMAALGQLIVDALQVRVPAGGAQEVNESTCAELAPPAPAMPVAEGSETAAPKPAAPKPAARKPAAPKPAARKSAVRKSAAPKPAVRKPAPEVVTPAPKRTKAAPLHAPQRVSKRAPKAPSRLDLGEGAASKWKTPRLTPPPPTPMTNEFSTGGLSVGDAVEAMGRGPGGGRAWFKARVTALRAPPAWPPIVVKFTSTLEGVTHRLALPYPVTAYVHADQVRAA